MLKGWHAWGSQSRTDLRLSGCDRPSRAGIRIRPGLATAHFVLAGVALRDMELEQADGLLDTGLRQNRVPLSF